MKAHYLEIVSLDVDAVCQSFEVIHKVSFGEPDALLGGAKTVTLADGSMIGVRSPLRDTEAPIIRPYWLVEDIGSALAQVESQGAQIAVPPMEIVGKGKFAIYLLGVAACIFKQRAISSNEFGKSCVTININTFKLESFQAFVDEFRNFVGETKAVRLITDGAASHRSRRLKIGEQLEIEYLPPYSPELNPVERFFKELRCPAPICYSNGKASNFWFSIFDLNSFGVKYSKLECGRSWL